VDFALIGSNLIKLVSRYWMNFVKGTGITLLLSVLTVVCGLVLGTLIYFLRTVRFKPLGWLTAAYVEFVRGTPLLLQLTFFVLILPMLFPVLKGRYGISTGVALILNSAAYVSEVIRAGIQAVDRGQSEAARSLGLNGKQTMMRIVLPQAIKNILPALGNEFVTVIKETSLASVFFVGDLMTQYKVLSGAVFLGLESLIVMSVIYFLLTFTMGRIVGALERRLRSSD